MGPETEPLVRLAIFQAWNERCVWCGKPIFYNSMEIDHGAGLCPTIAMATTRWPIVSRLPGAAEDRICRNAARQLVNLSSVRVETLVRARLSVRPARNRRSLIGGRVLRFAGRRAGKLSVTTFVERSVVRRTGGRHRRASADAHQRPVVDPPAVALYRN